MSYGRNIEMKKWEKKIEETEKEKENGKRSKKETRTKIGKKVIDERQQMEENKRKICG